MSACFDLKALREQGAAFVRGGFAPCAVALAMVLAMVSVADAGAIGSNSAFITTNVFPDSFGCGNYAFEISLWNVGPDDMVSVMLPIYDIDAVCYVYAPPHWTWELLDPATGEIWDIDTDAATGTFSTVFAAPGGPYGPMDWSYVGVSDPNAGLYTRPAAFDVADLPFILHIYTIPDGSSQPEDPIPADGFRAEFYYLTPYDATPAPYLAGHLFAGTTLGGTAPFGGYQGIMPNSPTYDPVTPACDGDVDGDHDVDFADLNELLDHWGASVPPGTMGDLDKNGTVNFADLNILLDSWGDSC
ncbi:MAG: hypothetical protein KDA21_03940 [Phycisphaerales bacterium]|nr:hypothetical protein [Phycisphaerales bacterium]